MNLERLTATNFIRSWSTLLRETRWFKQRETRWFKHVQTANAFCGKTFLLNRIIKCYQLLSIIICGKTLWQPFDYFFQRWGKHMGKQSLHSVAKRVIGAKHLLCCFDSGIEKPPTFWVRLDLAFFKAPKKVGGFIIPLNLEFKVNHVEPYGCKPRQDLPGNKWHPCSNLKPFEV